MRLLYIQDSLGTGGAERSNAELWYFLREHDVELKVVVLEHRAVGIEDEIIKNGFDVVFLSEGNFLKQSWELKGIIKEYQPDLVHSVLFRSVMRTRIAKLFSKFYHVESIVNCTYSPIRFRDPQINSLGLKIYQLLNKSTQSWGTDKFVAITEEVKQHAKDYLNIPDNKIVVISRGRKENPYLTTDKNVKLELREELALPKDELLFVHVGRQEYQKGHVTLLKAIGKNDDELRKLKVHFIFCGRDGNETKKIEEFLANQPIRTKISWLGHRNDILKILPACDVFVFPSLFEGLGGALIEAQAAGLPVVCSDIQVFNEVVKKDRNALLFEVQNSDQLGKIMLSLAKSENLRLEMGKESIINFRMNFLIDEVHQKMQQFYEKILEKAKSEDYSD